VNELQTDTRKMLKIEIYTSPTCPYCPAALRMLKKAAGMYKGYIEIIEVSIVSPEGQQLAAMYKIQATPTIIMNGEVKFRGAPPSESVLFDEIERYLDKDITKKVKKLRQARKQDIDMMFG